jgi:hypothetical protein
MRPLVEFWLYSVIRSVEKIPSNEPRVESRKQKWLLPRESMDALEDGG